MDFHHFCVFFSEVFLHFFRMLIRKKTRVPPAFFQKQVRRANWGQIKNGPKSVPIGRIVPIGSVLIGRRDCDEKMVRKNVGIREFQKKMTVTFLE